MHLVSCRHRTSGLTDFKNLATRSMRSRTELIFQVVRERRMGTGNARYVRPMTHVSTPQARRILARRYRVIGEVDLEQAGIDFPGGIQIVDGDRGVIALRVGHGPLL